MTSLAMQKTFYIKLLWGKSAVALELYMLTRQLRVVKSSILAQHCNQSHSTQSCYFRLDFRHRLLYLCYFGTVTDKAQALC
jgi:hypothetical protein